MNSATALTTDRCPHCGGTHVAFRSKAAVWECQDCEERFPGFRPTVRRVSDRATNPRTIFFSYGHDENRELVELFKESLERRGHQVWFDAKDIGTWDDWKGAITRGIDVSNLAIAFMSRHSIRDPGVCRNEVAIAMNRFGTVYPILLESGIEKDIPVTIANLQWPDLSQWRDIHAGKMPGVDWSRWYEERLLNLIEKLEGEATRFAEETRILRQALRPASFESIIAQHVPGFTGREWLFTAHADWLEHQPDSRLFWIKAGPGVGKSAIAASLAHRHRGAVVASWFCDARSIDLQDPGKAIRSLAFQLALRWEDYRVRLMRILGLDTIATDEDCRNARSELARRNYQDLFRTLLAEPMTSIIWREHKLVIVIDALDEATDKHGNNRITELLAMELSSLPDWVGFVVTSRPEADVVNRLQGFRAFEIDAQDQRNVDDLRGWYRAHTGRRTELEVLPASARQRIEDILIVRSAGMMLYLKAVEEGLREGSLTVSELEALESGLPGLYRRYFDSFQRRFGDDYETLVRPLFRLVLAASGPLPEDLAGATLGVDLEQFVAIRQKIGSYLCESATGLRIFHNTLRAWLTDRASGRFFVAPELGQNQLGETLWKHFHSTPDTAKLQWPTQLQEWLPEWLPASDHWDDHEGLIDFGIHLAESNCFLASRPVLERAIVLRGRGSGHGSGATIGLDNLALVCVRLADCGYLAEAMATADTLSAEPRHAMNLAGTFVRAYCLRRQGRLVEAQTLLAQCSPQAVSALLPGLALRVRYQTAHVSHLLGHYQEASAVYGAVTRATAQCADETEARDLARRQLADIAMLRGEFRVALATFHICSTVTSRDPLWALECQRFIGHVYRHNWIPDKAVTIYTEVVAQCREAGFLAMQGKVLVNLTEVYCWSDPPLALSMAEQAIEINERTGNLIEVGKARTALALAELFLGHSDAALAQADLAEAIQARAQYQSGLMFVEAARALIYRLLGDDGRMQHALQSMDATTQELGVYRFLTWVYGSVCDVRVSCRKADFDWLENTPVDESIDRIAYHLTGVAD